MVIVIIIIMVVTFTMKITIFSIDPNDASLFMIFFSETLNKFAAWTWTHRTSSGSLHQRPYLFIYILYYIHYIILYLYLYFYSISFSFSCSTFSLWGNSGNHCTTVSHGTRFHLNRNICHNRFSSCQLFREVPFNFANGGYSFVFSPWSVVVVLLFTSLLTDPLSLFLPLKVNFFLVLFLMLLTQLVKQTGPRGGSANLWRGSGSAGDGLLRCELDGLWASLGMWCWSRWTCGLLVRNGVCWETQEYYGTFRGDGRQVCC